MSPPSFGTTCCKGWPKGAMGPTHSGYIYIIDETLIVVQKGYLGLLFLHISRFKSVGDAGLLVLPTLVQWPLSGPCISSSRQVLHLPGANALSPQDAEWTQFSQRLFGSGPEGPTHLPRVLAILSEMDPEKWD
ncbi:hypothetical protein TNIN_98591 [Trichonephila inaurata madagascariensis]|uniref:Uncharacterized protein n=1 Tax=Trichonephila inaurata madagascariensis TaxID=2747483 RepID=A0A8X6Y208_9ARAC|nr:hypothetical protein TNIN_98591 [Trichonephila inaurata madagascariensis]